MMTRSTALASGRLGTQRTILLVITAMLSGRAMTLAFIGDAGSGAVGDPPAAWLMPLVGDAVIGLGAFVVAYLIVRGQGLGAWTVIVVWNSIGVWDAFAAFLIHRSVPWPEFFMIELFGSSMFLAAGLMHIANLYLISREPVRNHYL
ncbi:MAG: hypothetical protein M3132_02910 [Actinomycetia bacterium]|nr:hypothetical protein [Actinomycetes bacterium]